MSTKKTADRFVQNCLSYLQDVMEECPLNDFSIQLWDGTTWEPQPGQPSRFSLMFKHPGAMRKMFWSPNQLTLGEAYIHDDFDIHGDIEAAISLAEVLCGMRLRLIDKLRQACLFLFLSSSRPANYGQRTAQLSGAVHSEKRDREAISHHYNVSNDFYRLWLDERMVYSCAYFSSPDEELGKAQERKLDHICRKLRLKAGERLLDIGCGWGGLIIHAVRNYGVTAVGITLSTQQAELASERIREAGVADRCRVELRDYRELDEWSGYDKLASVGMFEHVGKDQLANYFEHACRLLRPGGAFLNHGITQNLSLPLLAGPSFIDRYVFPDGELVSLDAALHEAESAGFEVRDLESLREHYLLTLRQWIRRLEASHAEALRITDDVAYRIWRLYMAGSAHGFKTGQLNVYQALLVKPDHGDSTMPLTRADWYQ